MLKARCAEEGVPTEYFFDEYIKNKEVFELVNDVCARCVVSSTCLTYGMNTKSIGVWGGKWLQYGQIVDVISEESIDGDDLGVEQI